MLVTKNDFIYYVDVDGTLIFNCTKNHPDAVRVDYYGQKRYVRPHKNHMTYIKSLKKRGYHVIIHTANGWQWALEIVNKFNLKDYVDEVKTKSIKYLDDRPANEWAGIQVYISENE